MKYKYDLHNLINEIESGEMDIYSNDIEAAISERYNACYSIGLYKQLNKSRKDLLIIEKNLDMFEKYLINKLNEERFAFHSSKAVDKLKSVINCFNICYKQQELGRKYGDELLDAFRGDLKLKEKSQLLVFCPEYVMELRREDFEKINKTVKVLDRKNRKIFKNQFEEFSDAVESAFDDLKFKGEIDKDRICRQEENVYTEISKINKTFFLENSHNSRLIDWEV